MSLLLAEAKLTHLLLTGHVFQPPTFSVLCCVLQYFGESKLDTILQLQYHMCQIEGNDHFSWPADYTLTITAQYMIGCLPGFPGPFLQHCFSTQPASPSPARMLYIGYPLRCRTLCLPLLNFTTLLAAHFSNLSSSLWIAALPSKISTTLIWYCLQLAESTFNPIIHVVNKDIKPYWGQ